MQTQNIQLPTLNANAVAAPRVNLNLQSDNTFQRALSREMDQSQNSIPLTSSAAKNSERPALHRDSARPNESAKPASAGTAAAASKSNSKTDSKPVPQAVSTSDSPAEAASSPDAGSSAPPQAASNSASTAGQDSASTAENSAAAASNDVQLATQVDPMTQMLALVAAFNQPVSTDHSNSGESAPAPEGKLNPVSAQVTLQDSVTPSAPAEQPLAPVLATAATAWAPALASAGNTPASTEETPALTTRTLQGAAPAIADSSATTPASQQDSVAVSLNAAAVASAPAYSPANSTPKSSHGAVQADFATALKQLLPQAVSVATPSTPSPASSDVQLSTLATAMPSATANPSTTLPTQMSMTTASEMETASPSAASTTADAGATYALKPEPGSAPVDVADAAASPVAEVVASSPARTDSSEVVAPAKEAAPAINAANHAQSNMAMTKTALANVPAEKLSSRVGTPAWDQQLGQKIIFMAAGGEQSATMELNPPDLGPLQVVLSVNKDQATAAFTSAQPEVRQALEAALPKLKEMMSEAGIQLGNASVSAGMSDQGNSFSQQASAAQSDSGRSASGGHGAAARSERAPQHSEPVGSTPTRRVADGAVDTFA